MSLLDMLVGQEQGGEVWAVERPEEACLFVSDVVNADSP